MESYQWVSLIAALWAFLYLFDSYLKFNAAEKWQMLYRRIVTDNGVSVHLARCQWYTKKLNRLFRWLGKTNPTYLDKWFDAGIVAALLCCCCSIVFLVMVPINTLLRAQSKDEQILRPVIPGVNLPRKDLGYYLITLFLSAVLHELGHAVAAVRESVRVHGFGIFLFVVYPGAFVDMDDQTLFAVSPWRQLRIFCGGVWHNIVIVIVGVACLYTLPLTLSPFYTVHEDLILVSHTENSVVQGESGLFPGDIITQMDDVRVSSVSEWINHLVNSLDSQSITSYSVPEAIFMKQEKPIVQSSKQCECGDVNHICFQASLKADKPLAEDDRRCMNAREVITYSRCPKMSTVKCVTPYISHLDNSTRLVVLYRSKKPPVLFYGHPAELHQSGEVAPRSDSTPLWIPYSLENIFKCFVSLSGALAILNIIPCYALDGQHIARALVSLILSRWSKESKELVLTLMVLCGTILLCGNLLLAMYGLLF
ncbi:membrane-bound transcription factor site-2 protease-like isoform X2 [Watersipora subatra]|uniref:membrane-bound transcription factor site-2 protease-like isoform X2 n=1 Tax=Watersipora subatra TaxID=2589382 RepID=UPI00355C9625